MIKVSKLLKVDNWVHCVAHALHLLLVTDSMKKVQGIMGVLTKCKAIVHTLHFKAEILEREVKNANNRAIVGELLDMITQLMELSDAESKCQLNEEDGETEQEGQEAAVVVGDSDKSADDDGNELRAHMKLKKAHRLQNEVCTRWNSCLQMTKSLVNMRAEVTSALKSVGKYDQCLKAHEWALVEELTKFLQPFQSLTDLVSTQVTSLSLIPLIRAEIADASKVNEKDSEDLKSLKKLINTNLNKRFPLTNAVKLATILDPGTKSMLSEADEEMEDILLTAVRELSKSTQGDQDSNSPAVLEQQRSGVSGQFDVLSTTATSSMSDISHTSTGMIGVPPGAISRRMKLIQKHSVCPLTSADVRLRDEIKNYLRFIPGEHDHADDPLLFWSLGRFPLLDRLAKNVLTQSASSVPVENMFSTMGLILNGKRSSLAPHRANWLSFVHDNYATYFKISNNN